MHFFLRFAAEKLGLYTGENPSSKKNLNSFFYLSSYVHLFSEGGVNSLQFRKRTVEHIEF